MTIGIDLTIFRTYQGTEVYTENLIGELIKVSQDHRVVIFKGKHQFVELEQMCQKLGLGDRVRFVNFLRFRSSVGVILTQQILLPILVLKHRISVLYSLSPFFSFLAPCKKINTIHDAAYKRFREFRSLFSKLYIQLSFYLSFLCRHIVTSSEFSKGELMSQYGFLDKQVVVVKAALPVLPDIADSYSDEVLAKFELTATPYLFYIGSFNPRKNIAGMLESFEYYISNYSDANLLFVLAGNQNRNFIDIEKYINNPVLAKRIKLLGVVTNAQKAVLLKNAKALFFASYYEGFGLPILEAQSLHTPVITSTTTSMPEVAGDGALFVNPYDITEVGTAIASVLQPNTAQQLVSRGSHNLSRFDWSQSARQLLEIMQNL